MIGARNGGRGGHPGNPTDPHVDQASRVEAHVSVGQDLVAQKGVL